VEWWWGGRTGPAGIIIRSARDFTRHRSLPYIRYTLSHARGRESSPIKASARKRQAAGRE